LKGNAKTRVQIPGIANACVQTDALFDRPGWLVALMDEPTRPLQIEAPQFSV
jgi:hypothetical protein